ncbi:Hpt domain-containing protein [Mesorhizobium sp. ZC-5]|uniref:Hpt domain-containing protein n=1 Tax=Mesorhizobium sp. ZC-5 TaxID=2986066 RepID=UPI0021E84189|nr:Hpt domain-containing protein [Mesorhizobium sp. ZC-5]MCV3238647.1 Hpt domain-containing protein [Mesorhizobium sp. ZC-5]
MTSDPFTDIRNRFIERCRSDLHSLEELKSAGFDNPDASVALTKIAHSLAGAGGIFGFPEISNKAFALEALIIEGEGDNQAIAALDELIQILGQVSASSG